MWKRDGVYVREKGRVWEREGESMEGGGRVRMVVGEGECMGKGGSFKGRERKYEREKGRVWERDEEFVREERV